MRNLKIEHKGIKSVFFMTNNGIGVDIHVNGDSTVSITHGCNSVNIQADYNEYDLKEYIDLLQTCLNQIK